jgi:hypothetical protein
MDHDAIQYAIDMMKVSPMRESLLGRSTRWHADVAQHAVASIRRGTRALARAIGPKAAVEVLAMMSGDLLDDGDT